MDKIAERPPYIRFERRPVEDQSATIAAGHVVYKDIDYILVTPGGSKDVHEAVAVEWLARTEAAARAGRFPMQWLNQFKAHFEAWKKDEEPPVTGTSILHWPGLSKAQMDQLRTLRYLTVEDVATMNEEGISRMGMGGRALKQRAEAFLAAQSGPAKQAEQMAALQVQNQALLAQVAKQGEQLATLMAKLGEPAPMARPAAAEPTSL